MFTVKRIGEIINQLSVLRYPEHLELTGWKYSKEHGETKPTPTTAQGQWADIPANGIWGGDNEYYAFSGIAQTRHDIAVIVQIGSNARCAHVGTDILGEDDLNNFYFIFGNLQISVHQLVAVGRETAVPLAFAGLLLTTCHRLDADVLTLDLGYGRQYGNHQLAGILGGVDAVLHTDQVHAVILHQLQGVQHIGGVASETGQLEHQHIGHAVLAFLDILQHLSESQPPLNVLA